MCLLAGSLGVHIPLMATEAEIPDPEGVTWRVEYDNDVFFNSDDKFTSGLSIQRHSNTSPDWEGVRMPRWTKFGARLPGLRSPGLSRRIGFAIGQNIQTPEDITTEEFQPDDVPYAGTLGAELNWIAFNDDRFIGYGLVVGVVGNLSGAEQVQTLVHDVIRADEPKGWDHQLPNEFAFNFFGMSKRKLARVGDRADWSADVSFDADFGIGTAMMFAEAGIEARWGLNMPAGFTFLPDPIGRSIAYDAAAGRPVVDKTSVYFSLAARRVWMPHFIFLDGSLWRDTHSVNKNDSLEQVIFGFHVERAQWAVRLSFWKGSDIVDSTLAENPSNDFGTIAVEWQMPR